MLERDYKKLYSFQNRFFKWWKTIDIPLYLTGGTALGRFYLNHRFSDDLDFFISNNPDYKKYIEIIAKKLEQQFDLDKAQTVFYDDYSRFFLYDNDVFLKLEFVNDVSYHSGKLNNVFFGKIDTPVNILSNKLTAIINRDEPKDIFDIIHISLNYNFSWREVFLDAKNKAILNEIDVEQRINTFPIEWLKNVKWLREKPNLNFYKECLRKIADDFLTGKDNSICKTNINIVDAIPNVQIEKQITDFVE